MKLIHPDDFDVIIARAEASFENTPNTLWENELIKSAYDFGYDRGYGDAEEFSEELNATD